MKVAFDQQAFAAQEYGGVSRYCTRLVEELAAAGTDVRVVAPLYINRYLAEVPARLVTGRHIAPSRLASRAMRAVNGALVRPLIARQQADIVHETYFARMRSGPTGVPTVLTIYDMIHERFTADYPDGAAVVRDKAAAIARADHILCISESTRRDLIEYYPDTASRSSVTLLGFDAPPAAPVPMPAPRPYLLFVGQRANYKNFFGLLDAYAGSSLLRDGFDLVAVGGGRFEPDEIAAIAAHRLQDRVRQIGASEAELPRWYAGAAAFVYPSLYEGFGIPPLEAMAAGTPVVAVAAASVPEVCGDAAAYADSGAPEALRAAIERVVGSPSRRQSLIEAGHARLTRFSWSRCAAETLAAYRSLM